MTTVAWLIGALRSHTSQTLAGDAYFGLFWPQSVFGRKRSSGSSGAYDGCHLVSLAPFEAISMSQDDSKKWVHLLIQKRDSSWSDLLP
eukprot:3457146-Prymnesium_polylepis.1